MQDKPKKKKLSSLKKRILLERVSRWEAANPPLAQAAGDTTGTVSDEAHPGAQVLRGAGRKLAATAPAFMPGRGAASSTAAADAGGGMAAAPPGTHAVVRLRGVVSDDDVADQDE